jgi:drug/metabolite transporter (DMT)-like permease
LSWVLALLGAGANAASSILQRKANRAQPRQRRLNWRLLPGLFRQPVWFAGIGAIVLGFLLQAAALRFGSLALVEPILVVELPITLLAAARAFDARPSTRDWLSIGLLTVGLGGLLATLAPAEVAAHVMSERTWLVGLAVTVGMLAALVGWGRYELARDVGNRAAAVLGIAGGGAFGLTAALMKGTTDALAGGIPAVLACWQLYAMAAAGLGALFLVQTAMNAGPLMATQPGLTLADPVVSILWGVLGFHERIRAGWFVLPEVLTAALVAIAVVRLARSPVLSGRAGTEDGVGACPALTVER